MDINKLEIDNSHTSSFNVELEAKGKDSLRLVLRLFFPTKDRNEIKLVRYLQTNEVQTNVPWYIIITKPSEDFYGYQR